MAALPQVPNAHGLRHVKSSDAFQVTSFMSWLSNIRYRICHESNTFPFPGGTY